MSEEVFAGMECGGTSFKCAVGLSDGKILDYTKLDTTTPEETLSKAVDFFRQHRIRALAVGSFGPVDTDVSSANYGLIGATPKLAWRHFNIKDYLQDELNISVNVRTDVAVAATGEYWRGSAAGTDRLFYMTIGTGIGGVLLSAGIEDAPKVQRPIEVGHMRVPDWKSYLENSIGICPSHGDCLEGLASGPALEHYRDVVGGSMDDAAFWDRAAELLAIGIFNISMILQPDKFVLGGGVMQREGLIEAIRHKLDNLNSDYISYPDMDSYLCSSFSEQNGVIGAIKISSQA